MRMKIFSDPPLERLGDYESAARGQFPAFSSLSLFSDVLSETLLESYRPSKFVCGSSRTAEPAPRKYPTLHVYSRLHFASQGSFVSSGVRELKFTLENA